MEPTPRGSSMYSREYFTRPSSAISGTVSRIVLHPEYWDHVNLVASMVWVPYVVGRESDATCFTKFSILSVLVTIVFYFANLGFERMTYFVLHTMKRSAVRSQLRNRQSMVCVRMGGECGRWHYITLRRKSWFFPVVHCYHHLHSSF